MSDVFNYKELEDTPVNNNIKTIINALLVIADPAAAITEQTAAYATLNSLQHRINIFNLDGFSTGVILAANDWQHLFEHYLQNGGELQHLAIGAAYGGHYELLQYFIEQMQLQALDYRLQDIAEGAARGGHAQLLNQLIHVMQQEQQTPDFNWIAMAAIRSDHNDIVILLLAKMAQQQQIPDFESLLGSAIANGNIKLLKILIDIMRKHDLVPNFDELAKNAAEYAHPEIALELSKMQAKKPKTDALASNSKRVKLIGDNAAPSAGSDHPRHSNYTSDDVAPRVALAQPAFESAAAAGAPALLPSVTSKKPTKRQDNTSDLETEALLERHFAEGNIAANQAIEFNDASEPDYANPAAAPATDPYYKYGITDLHAKDFFPQYFNNAIENGAQPGEAGAFADAKVAEKRLEFAKLRAAMKRKNAPS